MTGPLDERAGGARRLQGRPFARIRGSHPDPLYESLDVARREFLLRRHLDPIVFVANCLDQKAPLRLARSNHDPGAPASHPSGSAIEEKPTLNLRRLA